MVDNDDRKKKTKKKSKKKDKRKEEQVVDQKVEEKVEKKVKDKKTNEDVNERIQSISESHADRNDDDDDDSSIDDIFDAVSNWAQQKEDEENDKASNDDDGKQTRDKKQKRQKLKERQEQQQRQQQPQKQDAWKPVQRSVPTNLSLHITNLPYDATRASIQKVFVDAGCQITSIRLVFNHHRSRRDRDQRKSSEQVLPKNGFTGVAFVDVLDHASHQKALKLDKTPWAVDGEGEEKGGSGWRRRRINVRPTRTKEELAAIVSNTQEKLAYQKQQSRNEYPDANASNILSNNPAPKTKEKKKDSKSEKKEKKKDCDTKRKRDNTTSDNDQHKRQKDGSKKLTKKERARKAAILRSKRN